MARTRPDNSITKGPESILFDPWLWLVVGIILFFLWAGSPGPRFGPQQGERAKVSTAQTQVEQFKSAAQLFKIDNGRAPKSLDELIHQPSKAGNWKKYLSDLNEIPKDPWNNDYVYQTPATNGDDFEIKSYGPDGKDGGDDISSTGRDNGKAGG